MSDQELVPAVEEGAAEEPEVTPTNTDGNALKVEAEVENSEVDNSARTGEAAVEEESEEPSPASEDSADGQAGPGSILGLKRGQHLTGKIKNIAEFGAFVDIGLPQDGLIHISELSRKKVEKVEDVVNVGQEVDVWVKKVDRKRGRISLTLIKPISLRLRDIAEESELEGKITRLKPYGAFVDIGSERDGLVHISQITHEYIKHPADILTVGDVVPVKVLKVNRKKRQVDLSIKALLPPPVEEVEEVQEVETVQKEDLAEEPVEEEPTPTAMALAYAAMKDKKKPASSATSEKEAKDKQKQEMDEIIARTLAAGE